jgi:triosephosphate isomerase (TIM)
MRKKYIIANWKMNPMGVRDAQKLFEEIKKKAPKFRNVRTIICPPHIFLGELTCLYSGTKIEFGAQDSFWENKGSRTGEVSPVQIKDIGANYVLLGHSERRAMGETNEEVSKKIKVAINAGLSVVLCIGEKTRNEDGEHLHFIKEEIIESLKGVQKNNLSKIIIAYEPVWAVGKGNEAMVSREVHQMKLFILKMMKELYGSRGMEVPIIYGGSSGPGNTEELIKGGEVDGLLVGRESLIPSNFIEMIKIADSLK